MGSEAVASVEVEAAVDVFYNFGRIHPGEIIEGVAYGNGGIDKP
jgi:hypothetical protein